MLSFERAIEFAIENAKKLVPNSREFQIEGAVISENKKNYEIALSYESEGPDFLSEKGSDIANINALSYLLSSRRKKKIFMIKRDTGEFVGFKPYKEM